MAPSTYDANEQTKLDMIAARKASTLDITQVRNVLYGKVTTIHALVLLDAERW
jgi:hypothetical protein